jgi:hypothetical protein
MRNGHILGESHTETLILLQVMEEKGAKDATHEGWNLYDFLDERNRT